MSQPIIGNKTFSLAPPSDDFAIVPHDQNVGADGFLLVVCQMRDSVAFTGATYNGVSMVKIQGFLMGGLAQDYVMYGLSAPATGVNDIVVNFDGNQFAGLSIVAYSFTESDGYGVYGQNDQSASPHTQSLTVSSDSLIFASGSATQTIASLVIGGSSRPIDYQHNTNKEVGGGLSGFLTAGSKDVVITSQGTDITNFRVEILGKTVAPAIRRRVVTF